MTISWTSRKIKHYILDEAMLDCSLEALMVKLKFRYFGCILWQQQSLKKTLMLEKSVGNWKSSWQKTISKILSLLTQAKTYKNSRKLLLTASGQNGVHWVMKCWKWYNNNNNYGCLPKKWSVASNLKGKFSCQSPNITVVHHGWPSVPRACM